MKNPRNYNDLMRNSRSQNNKSHAKPAKQIKVNGSFIDDMTSQQSLQENPITENTMTLTQSLALGDVNSLRVDFIHKIHRNPFVQPYLKQVNFLSNFIGFPGCSEITDKTACHRDERRRNPQIPDRRD